MATDPAPSNAANAALAPLLKNARIDHISVIVRDLDVALSQYARLYSGPFKRYAYQNTARVFGEVTTYSLRMAVGKIGEGLDVEIIQLVDGNHRIHSEFLRDRGEGVQHVAYQVDDLVGAVKAFEAAGFPVILEKADGTGSAVYVDTRPVGGLITELIRSGYTLDVIGKAEE